MAENTVEYRGKEYTEEELDDLAVKYFKTGFTVLFGSATFYKIAEGDLWMAYGIVAAGITIYYIFKGYVTILLADGIEDSDEVEDE